jgi:TRAP-type C4-dicarboxylate transport system permease small subunit
MLAMPERGAKVFIQSRRAAAIPTFAVLFTRVHVLNLVTIATRACIIYGGYFTRYFTQFSFAFSKALTRMAHA